MHTYFEDLINAGTALIKQNLDIARHCHRAWKRGTRTSSLHQLFKLAILHNVHQPIALGAPPGNVGSKRIG